MKKAILLTVLVLLISSGYSFAEVPCKINYQGRLIENNVPVDGTKTMKFSILSSIDDWTAGETLYLEVKVETDILTPREELYAYPYAINSHLLEGATKEYFLNTSGEEQTKQGNLNIMGNVGIGTTSPASKLDVSGAIKYSGSYTGTILYGNTNSTGTPTGDGFRVRYNADFFGTNQDALVIEKTDGNQDSPDGGIAFVNTGQDGIEDTAMVIKGTGNVGIGTSPGEKLEVDGAIKIGNTTGTNAGTIRWTGTAFEGYNGTTWVPLGGGASFGSWTDKDSNGNTLVRNVTYQATSDGFVTAYITNGDGDLNGYTDSSKSAVDSTSSSVRRVHNGYGAYSVKGGMPTMPVKKNDYWRINQREGWMSSYEIYWIPISNGESVRQ